MLFLSRVSRLGAELINWYRSPWFADAGAIILLTSLLSQAALLLLIAIPSGPCLLTLAVRRATDMKADEAFFLMLLVFTSSYTCMLLCLMSFLATLWKLARVKVSLALTGSFRWWDADEARWSIKDCPACRSPFDEAILRVLLTFTELASSALVSYYGLPFLIYPVKELGDCDRSSLDYLKNMLPLLLIGLSCSPARFLKRNFE